MGGRLPSCPRLDLARAARPSPTETHGGPDGQHRDVDPHRRAPRRRGRRAARSTQPDDRRVAAAPARPGLRRPRRRVDRPLNQRPAQPPVAVRQRPPRPAPATSRSSRSTRASSTRPPRASRPTRCTSTRRTSSGSPSRAAATPSPRPSASSASVAASTAHRIPFIVKLNHNELLTYPNQYDQIMFGIGPARLGARRGRRRRDDLLRLARRATARSSRSPRPSRRPTGSACSPCSGATCGTPASSVDGVDYHVAADLTGQANHLGVTIEADIIKQKLPEVNNGYGALNRNGQATARRTSSSTAADDRQPDRPDALPGRQLLHGPRAADQQRRRLVRRERPGRGRRAPRSINKRAGGIGLISGRKAFQRPIAEGVALLHAIQDVYLSHEVTIAYAPRAVGGHVTTRDGAAGPGDRHATLRTRPERRDRTCAAPARRSRSPLVVAALRPRDAGDAEPSAGERRAAAQVDARGRRRHDRVRLGGGERARSATSASTRPSRSSPARRCSATPRRARALNERLRRPAGACGCAATPRRRDRYGRLLAYVYRARDGLFVNAELVRRGYARRSRSRPTSRTPREFAGSPATRAGAAAGCGRLLSSSLQR